MASSVVVDSARSSTWHQYSCNSTSDLLVLIFC